MALLHDQGEHAEADERGQDRRDAAVSEMTIDRNAIASTMNVTPMMKSRKYGIRSMIWSAMSLNAAVWPET